MKNVENALPVQNYIGGNAHGGYWNDGSLMLTPGTSTPLITAAWTVHANQIIFTLFLELSWDPWDILLLRM